MSIPGAEADPRCGCRADFGEVCAKCGVNPAIRTPSVPTATIPRPSPGSAAELHAELHAQRTAILDIHAALNAAGAPMGGSPVERIEKWAAFEQERADIGTRKPWPSPTLIDAIQAARAANESHAVAACLRIIARECGAPS